MIKRVDEGNVIDLLCMELQNIFDEVFHYRLIIKTERHEVKRTITAWLENWITG